MEGPKLRIASRTSPLALFQTNEVIDRLIEIHTNWEFSVVPVSTKGDKDQSTSLQNLGQTGIFTKALDDAILGGKADVGVHSLKDYPTNIPKGLKLLAVLPRDGYLDAFIPGSNDKSKEERLILLSGSPRRRAFWLNKYPNHKFKDLRGNMHTRVKKILSADGGIVSAPALQRIGLLPNNAELLDWMLPAPAQGVIAVIGRDGDTRLEKLVGKINHLQTYVCAEVERDFMASVESGCASPLGALCLPTNRGFSFEGALLSLDGKKKVSIKQDFGKGNGNDVGKIAAQRLLVRGGREIIDAIRELQPKDILCLKEIDKVQRTAALEMGLKLHDIEVLNLVPQSFELGEGEVVIIASSFGAEQLKNQLDELPGNLWAVGHKGVNILLNAGYSGNIRTFRNSGELVAAYQAEQPGTATYYGAQRTSQNWSEHGIKHIITYRNSAKPPRLARQQWDAILAFSPLGVESTLSENNFAKDSPVICIGERTADAALAQNFIKVYAAPQPDFTTLLQTLKNELS
ncbi:MAG TPA: hydroxymethylbilane synthase [Cryomorphaceae bacterium]|nr:hydroxymethylbilane synthase [Cryomorphaceae bacterium]|tara:strand:- start:3738 stop:5285 length:1548 start_codon:yes stop_codon:yes gene_type:complete